MPGSTARPLPIRVGVAGWDYADWAGIVYPPGRGRDFDRLAYLASFVDVIEINSTFYRPATPRVSASWVRRVCDHPGVRFSAKAHRSLTHEPVDIASDVEATLEGLTPLRDAGLLGALLLQFPQSFHRSERALTRLGQLAERLAGWPVVVEVRHVSWDDDRAVDWLREHGLGWCAVDQPQVGAATAAARGHVTSQVGYLRLHGRNAANWFRADAGRDARYDYLYDAGEIDELAGLAATMANQAAELFVVQNNHFRGQALVNALQMKRRLTGTPPLAPADLVRSYPALESAVRIQGRGLFP